MEEAAQHAIAIVALGAVMPEAPDASTFWRNLIGARYSITETQPDRWNPDWYYDDDPKAPDKTYSKIGGWVREFDWDPMGWRLPIPPKVSEAMDDAQKWAVGCTRAVLEDYGYPERDITPERTAVIIGNAMAGENHYRTALRVDFPLFADELRRAPSFQHLAPDVQLALIEEARTGICSTVPDITEDTMPGELANIIAGRVANIFDLHGPNFVTDAACASAMAAMAAAIDGLQANEFDTAITGGIDRNMGASTFVKFCKIGALSATGTRPYADGADGFVMGEGAALFMLKRLSDAERAGDRIYAVIRGVAGSSDGRGKGITAPNPLGQRLAVERAWSAAGIDPATVSYLEGHGTSTRVGDVVECEALAAVFGCAGAPVGSIGLGSVKSNIGHLKGAAGAAGLLKTVLALDHKQIPPSLSFTKPNPNIDFAHTPLRVVDELTEWPTNGAGIRRAGVSAFGFGGTNFHVVLEEHQPGRLTAQSRSVAFERVPQSAAAAIEPKVPLRGAVLVGGPDDRSVVGQLRSLARRAEQGEVPGPSDPNELRAPVRVAVDFGTADELAQLATKAADALATGKDVAWRLLANQGAFLGRGPARPVAFLYTGQGSQYVNMLDELRRVEPIVADTFAEADRAMTPQLGKPLTECIFTDGGPDAVAALEAHLKQTEITQPAVLATDLALTRLLAAYGIEPAMVMGHSLGEYGALVAAHALTFDSALEAVSARGREMADLTLADNGAMAAVMAPLPEIRRVIDEIDGYVVIANINSTTQSVVGGATGAVAQAVERFLADGHAAIPIPVSHAFHTEIVAPASEPLRAALHRLHVREPDLPVVANVTGDFYPMGGSGDERMLDLLGRQVASPVQFVKGLETLYDAGARVFVEVGPKKTLHGFTEDVLGDRSDVVALFVNHPKQGDVVAFNRALCGLWASGHGGPPVSAGPTSAQRPAATVSQSPAGSAPAAPASAASIDDSTYLELGHLFAEFLDRGRALYDGQQASPAGHARGAVGGEPVVITGAGLGLPGTQRLFDGNDVRRILDGEQLIDLLPTRVRDHILEKHIVRLVKRENGDPSFEEITEPGEVIKLAGRGGELDLTEDFGVEPERVAAFDIVTKLAIAAGIDALRDAGIPLVMHYKTTSVGTKLPERWMLPDRIRDETGVIFASAFPGLDSLVTDLDHFHEDKARHEQLELLERIRERVASNDPVTVELDHEIHELRADLERDPFQFDRRFLFRVLAMGHSQFAELIGARGPNTQVNAACASTTQAVALAEDWIRVGRCRRVVIVAGDDASSDHLIEWLGSGFLASGAAATDDVVEEAALPFDNRRHGMLLGMGAAALVVESPEAARERGIRPICEVLGASTANSAFHGTRLDVDHICQVMEATVSEAEARGIDRHEIASQMVFVSHETYTPARGGSASAEINALRAVFGEDADRIVIANTKGFTGHPMGVGIEDVVAVKALETGIVPPVPNFKEVDPGLGDLNLSIGGAYPVSYALRLAAGFGSQIAMTLLRWTPMPDGVHREPDELGYAYRVDDRAAWDAWLKAIGGTDTQLEVVQHRLRVVDTGPRPERAEVPPSHAVTESSPVATPAPAPVVEPVGVTSAAPTPAAHVAPEPVEGTVEAADAVEERVLAMVAEVTGYPPDMLDADLDLEADLGIDTVKQAEVFGSIRESFGIERDDRLQLRDYPTLSHVIEFVRERAEGVDRVEPAPAPVVEPVGVTSAAPTPAAHVAPEPVEGTVEAADAVEERVLAMVAEVTGYPPDMLDADLDLEADLGIDTVKQAEVFGSIRESFGIERDDRLQLRDYPTLSHVIEFVRERAEGVDRVEPAPAPVVEPVGAMKAAPTPAAHVAPEPVEGTIEAANAVARRVPVADLRLPIERFVRTGVELTATSRVVVVADRGGVAAELEARLHELGVDVLVINGAPEANALLASIDAWRSGERVTGLYWLVALDAEPALTELDLDGWHQATKARVKLLYETMRHLFDDIGGADSFLVVATSLGGLHGYGAEGATAPMGGAVTGFAKAYKRERAETLVKAVDFALGAEPRLVAEALLAETRRDPGCVEVGYHGEQRFTVTLQSMPADDGAPGMALGPDSIFVITGAAGSIVSAITADLAKHSGGTFHLVDMAPEPDPHDDDLRRFGTDRDGLKRDIFERRKASGERVTPALVDRDLARLERVASAQAAIEAVRDAGGEAYYHVADLTDAEAVAAVANHVRERHGRIDVLVHAAGVEVSHLLPDKPRDEFDLVFDVKCDGWFNLLSATSDLDIGATVVFSSVAGRFGNGGQSDYSAANDLLCKYSSHLRSARPNTRAIAIDWTAWADIGMATRGSIPKMMARAGIEVLPAAAGVATVRRELTLGATRGEVVVGGALGVLGEEFHETGGLDTAQLDVSRSGPMVGRVGGMGVYSGLTVETTLDPGEQPFLADHRISGTPVLPGVMGIEAFAETARLFRPDLHVLAVEDVEFLAPFKFYRDTPRTLVVQAHFRAEGDCVVARCALIGTRTLANQDSPLVTTHFTGSVRLGPALAAVPKLEHDDLGLAGRAAVGDVAIYEVYFHGPAYRVLDRVVKHDSGAAGILAEGLPDDRAPAEAPLTMAPRLIELCFQTAGVVEMATQGHLALPNRVGRVATYGEPSAATGRVTAIARPRAGGGYDCQVVDEAGAVLVRLDDYRTTPLPDALSDSQAAPFREALT